MAELVIPPQLRERHRRGLARYLAGGEGAVLDRWLELSGMRADGSEFPAELAITRIRGEDPPKFMGYIRDISERKRGQEALEFLVRASDALDESLDLESTLQALARLTVPFLADGCMVDLRGDDGSIRASGELGSRPHLRARARRASASPDRPRRPSSDRPRDANRADGDRARRLRLLPPRHSH